MNPDLPPATPIIGKRQLTPYITQNLDQKGPTPDGEIEVQLGRAQISNHPMSILLDRTPYIGDSSERLNFAVLCPGDTSTLCNESQDEECICLVCLTIAPRKDFQFIQCRLLPDASSVWKGDDPNKLRHEGLINPCRRIQSTKCLSHKVDESTKRWWSTSVSNPHQQEMNIHRLCESYNTTLSCQGLSEDETGFVFSESCL